MLVGVERRIASGGEGEGGRGAAVFWTARGGDESRMSDSVAVKESFWCKGDFWSRVGGWSIGRRRVCRVGERRSEVRS